MTDQEKQGIMEPVERVRSLFVDSIEAQSEAASTLAVPITQAADLMARALLADHRIFSCGNGASAALAQHFSACMLNRFEQERPGLPAIALTSDTATLTAIGNDYQFADIFAKQIRALGQPGDILLALTTSGNSHNLVQAVDAAHDRQIDCVLISGRDGGHVAGLLQNPDIEIRVASWTSARILEVHMVVLHAICDLIDRRLLGQED